jgi:nucleotide-binding universal stress UspA family protein
MASFKIEKILIPMDFSETAMKAVDHAAFIAKAFKAEIILLHVIEKHWEHFNIIQPELVVPQPSGLIPMVEKKLAQIASDISTKYGVKSITITSNGNIFSEIIAVSDEHHVDLIIMGTHGTKGVVEFFIGSNTYKIVTKSKCPVLSIQKNAETVGFKNILLPIDNSLHSRQKVNHVIILAKAFEATIHIAGIADSDDASEMKKFELKIEQVENLIKKSNIKYTSNIVVDSNPLRVTNIYAKTVNADLIVIMTDQDEKITGNLLGTFAQQIVNHSLIPVMSIQPELGEISYPSLAGGYHGA